MSATVCSNKNMLDVYKITDDVVTRNRYSDDNDDATLQRWKMIIHLHSSLSLFSGRFSSSPFFPLVSVFSFFILFCRHFPVFTTFLC